MKLRKKPVIIEAVQYTHLATVPIGCKIAKNGTCFIDAGTYEYKPKLGDWVCTENGTDYFVLTDDYIKEHFEEVE